jgi:hypothetical protein
MKLTLSFVVLLAFVCLALLATDTRVLIWETKVGPGHTYAVADYGNLGEGTLICRYFTGRDVVVNAIRYSPNNIMGRDSCRFLESP